MEAAIANAPSDYRAEFDRLSEGRPAWLEILQRAGIEAFEARGFPGQREEAWRKVDLGPVTAAHHPRVAGSGVVGPALTERLTTLPGHRVVFVDGVYAPSLCDLERLPAGITVAPLAGYRDDAPERLTAVLGARTDIEGHPFVALNTGLFADGVFVHAGRGVLSETPVVIVHVTTGDAGGHAVYPRTVVSAESGSELRVIEQYISVDDAEALVVPVSEVSAGDEAIVDYYRLQEEGAAIRHFGAVQINAGRQAAVRAHALSAGAIQSRVDYYADLDGVGADVQLNGLYLTAGRQFSDHHTWMNHRTEHGTSQQLFRGILQGRSETVFDGLVKVFEGAQKTDAQQQNRNLLLDKLALAHSNPRLEIHADDVKCAHGSTVGELDEDALFYLRSRGFGADQARTLLTLAFASEVLDGIRDAGVADHVRRVIMARLPGGAEMGEVT